ncbi:hypothetical protein P22_3348 [Propionispora sp. 2/2-37]|uniref:lipase chaperone n=1 Tax=Propionispora sp. 2/2-37 TaxID=1677858 RepID=UPI0006BB967E|nr:lipase chaperone [Propionispora sp. 2/2-37]CUH97221.1 hypothetical protein P22_3348 [Propionispora sp. 2/2-37]
MALQKKLETRIQQLKQLGYQPYQIRQIIEEAIGTVQWDRVSPASQQELVEKLEKQICFTVRCQKMKQQ